MSVAASRPDPLSTASDAIFVTVTDTSLETDDVLRLVLREHEGRDLPAWEPGAHIDVLLPSGLIRQYSLCGDPHDRDRYEIAVLNEPSGRGGSREIHQMMHAGVSVAIRSPRNHFRLRDAERYTFIAGGIGITPILAMIRQVATTDRSWRLIYGGRATSSMAFRDEVAALGHVDFVPEDSRGRLDIEQILGELEPREQVYACGPTGLLDALESACRGRGMLDRLHVERFGASESAVPVSDAGDQAFELELVRSGVTVQIGADETILDVVQDTAPDVLFSCGEGYCGTCQVPVLEGEPDHRDTVMSPAEHDEEGTMIMCVGRARSKRLVLDA